MTSLDEEYGAHLIRERVHKGLDPEGKGLKTSLSFELACFSHRYVPANQVAFGIYGIGWIDMQISNALSIANIGHAHD
jgi:hypothetical protein